MAVKFNVYAYPNTEYGYLTGTITSVSNDIKVDSQTGGAFYQAEATLDVKEFLDSDNTPLEMKAGMSCEAKIITGNRSIFTYVLDKLNLLFTD